MGFCCLRNRFVMFYRFKFLERGKLIFNMDFEFFNIFLKDGDILEKKKTLLSWYCVVVCNGTGFNYSSFIFVMD